MLEVHHAVRYALRFTGSLLFTHRSSGFLLSQRECFCNSAPSWCSFLHGLHKAVCIIRLHKTGDYSIQCFSGKALSSSTSIKTLSTPCDDSYYQSYASYSHSQLNNALLCYLAHTDPLQSMPHDTTDLTQFFVRNHLIRLISFLFLIHTKQFTSYSNKGIVFSITTIPKHSIFLPPWVPTTNAQGGTTTCATTRRQTLHRKDAGDKSKV